MKKSKLSRKRKVRSPKEILRDKAWATFSLWIRNRDKKCVTCGERETLQAGHFWHGKLDFDEVNINAQCTRCNKWLHGNLGVYSHYLLNKYGLKEFQALEQRKNIATKGEYRTEEDYLLIIEKYQLSTPT